VETVIAERDHARDRPLIDAVEREVIGAKRLEPISEPAPAISLEATNCAYLRGLRPEGCARTSGRVHSPSRQEDIDFEILFRNACKNASSPQP
jgi:hypothetical protein